MKKLITLLIFSAMVVLALAGCAAKGNENKVDYIIATDTVFKPFEYTNEAGEFVGIDVDLLAAIAADQGFTYELRSRLGSAIAACQARSGSRHDRRRLHQAGTY